MTLTIGIAKGHLADWIRSFLILIILVTFTSAAMAQDASAQFFAKIYTEGLGRAPDQDAWKYYVTAKKISASACTIENLSEVAARVYNSAEFLGDYDNAGSATGYDDGGRLEALYRGALNREPDQGGYDYFRALLKAGMSWAQVVAGVISTSPDSEFSALVLSSICVAQPGSDKGAYRFLPGTTLDRSENLYVATFKSSSGSVLNDEIRNLPPGQIIAYLEPNTKTL